jgi:hypothetical protein
MDRETVETMSQVAQKIALLKKELSFICEEDCENFLRLRELMNDCQAVMASYCDCAPIRLITGQVDDIMANHHHEILRIKNAQVPC